MSIFDGNMPYTNLHELNLDWVIKELKEVKSKEDDLDSAVETATEQAQIAVDAVSSLENAPNKYIFIGDSYNNPSTRVAWGNIVASCLGLANDKYRLMYQDGSGFIGNTATTFETLLRQSYTYETEPEMVKAVVVCGGCNDILSSITASALETAIQNFVSLAKSYYPKAVIYVGCCGRYYNTYDETIFNKVIPTYKLCVKYGATYLNNVEYAMSLSSYFDTDYTHPLPNGSREIGRAIANIITKGGYDCTKSAESIGVAVGDAFTSVTDVHFKQNVCDSVIQTYGQLTANGNLTMNNYTTYKLFKVFSNYDRATGWDIPIPAHAEIIDTSNNTTRGLVYLYKFYITNGTEVGLEYRIMPICLTNSATIKTVKIYL